MYVVEFFHAEVRVNSSLGEFRIRVEKALFVEGVQVGQWQPMPMMML
jgi:hypothetical protein